MTVLGYITGRTTELDLDQDTDIGLDPYAFKGFKPVHFVKLWSKIYALFPLHQKQLSQFFLQNKTDHD